MSQWPCIFCGENVEIWDQSGENKVYYPPDHARYAYHNGGCKGLGPVDTDAMWARIGQIPMPRRLESMLGSPGR